MTKEEAGKLLLLIHHFVPSYQPPKGAADSWREILGEISFNDAKKYLLDHFRESRFVPTPADIISRARAEFDPDKIVPLDPPDDMKGPMTC